MTALATHGRLAVRTVQLIFVPIFANTGTLQMCGVFINAVTYVTIVIAIGLLVDFLMHILLRYYETTGETREEKVKETLETMGASMLMGGFTTWLGVIPLSLSSTKIFNTIVSVAPTVLMDSDDVRTRPVYTAYSPPPFCFANHIISSLPSWPWFHGACWSA